MLLDQTGRCSEGHAAGQQRTVRIVAQGLTSLQLPQPPPRGHALIRHQVDQDIRSIDTALILFSVQDLDFVLANRRLIDLCFSNLSESQWSDLHDLARADKPWPQEVASTVGQHP